MQKRTLIGLSAAPTLIGQSDSLQILSFRGKLSNAEVLEAQERLNIHVINKDSSSSLYVRVSFFP